MNLKIGITSNKPGWQIILEQEGIIYEIISGSNEIKPDEITSLIVSGFNTLQQKENILNYIRSGGVALVDSVMSTRLLNIKTNRQWLRYLVAERGSIYSEAGTLYLGLIGKVPQANDLVFIDQCLKIYSVQIGKGIALILPFSVNEAIIKRTTARRKFYSPSVKELPSEKVARVTKSRIRKIVRISLEFLHHYRNLPFIQLWYYPKGAQNIFLFRVDTDFCSRIELSELSGVCEKNKIPGSWFVETRSSEKWITNFCGMESQEIGLHCYRHRVFKNYESNYENIEKGLKILSNSGIKPIGFVSPYGEWNLNLGKAIENSGFEYSSEFCLDYDNLPFYPYLDNKFTSVLQIPIHPVCTGRLRRSHFSEEEMWKYFNWIIEYKRRLNEPIVLYHHPLHKHFSLFDKVFKIINHHHDILKMSFKEYAQWWKMRIKVKPNIRIEEDKIFIEDKNFPLSIWLRISSIKGVSIVPIESKIELNNVNWTKRQKNIGLSDDLENIRKFRWRDWLYNIENKISKLRH